MKTDRQIITKQQYDRKYIRTHTNSNAVEICKICRSHKLYSTIDVETQEKIENKKPGGLVDFRKKGELETDN